MKAVLVCGTRPNFVRIAPMIWEKERHDTSFTDKPTEPIIVHTGRHYDYWWDTQLRV